MHRACENSLRRLQTDYLDMYLLHWRGDIPLQETVEAMEKLVAEGKIRRWGVSNLDTEDMQALWRTADGEHCATNQCSTISHRGALNTISCPRCQQHSLPVMAYCRWQAGGAYAMDFFSIAISLIWLTRGGITVAQLLLALGDSSSGSAGDPESGQY